VLLVVEEGADYHPVSKVSLSSDYLPDLILRSESAKCLCGGRSKDFIGACQKFFESGHSRTKVSFAPCVGENLICERSDRLVVAGKRSFKIGDELALWSIYSRLAFEGAEGSLNYLIVRIIETLP